MALALPIPSLAILEGTTLRLRRPTFETTTADWLAELEAIGKSGETLRAYRSDLKLWHESGVDPSTYLLQLAGTGAKPATVNRRRAVLRSYHEWLIDKGVIDKNPLERSKPVKNPTRLQRTLTVAEVARLIDATGQLGKERTKDARTETLGHMPVEFYRARLAAMIALQVTSGLRVSELCKARLDKLDLDARTIAVIRKGGNEQRLKFGMAARRKLDLWLVEREALDQDIGWFPPHHYLFVGAHGSNVLPRSYTRQLHEACWWADLEPIHPHTLRHTFATLAIESGIPVVDVQQMLGHASVATTMVYLHRHPDRGYDRYDRHPLEGELDECKPLSP